MIIAYVISKNGEITKKEISANEKLPNNVIWVDLLEPSIEEEGLVKKSLKVDIPSREEIDKIEVMSPFYKEDDSYFMTLTSISRPDKDYPEGVAIIFILTPKCLVTLRYSKPKAFSFVSGRVLRAPKQFQNPETVLEALVETIVNSTADVLEKTGNDIDQLMIDVFEKPSEMKKAGGKSNKNKNSAGEPGLYYTNIIRRIGRTGNLISKIRESLMSINRMLIFFSQIEENTFLSKKEHRNRFRNLAREIHSLTEYSHFLAQRNSFLLDATLGMVNVEQNMIIKVFTVAAAVFLPPTLIASIYGMNFHNMPELDSPFAYPLVLIAIILSAIGPYYYFKRKDWL